MLSKDDTSKAGFTLAELVVATTLMSIVMLGIYTTFHSTILHWRGGSENEGTYADARRIFTIIEHDLGGIPNDNTGVDAREFFLGDDSSIELITVIQPMNLDEHAIQRMMQVSYTLSNNQLMREERPLESPLLASAGPNSVIRRELLEYGREYERSIAEGVIDFELTYLWTPDITWEDDSVPAWVDLIESDVAEYRLPDGVTIDIVLFDPAKDPNTPGSRFTKTFLFEGETSRPPMMDPDDENVGGFDDAA